MAAILPPRTGSYLTPPMINYATATSKSLLNWAPIFPTKLLPDTPSEEPVSVPYSEPNNYYPSGEPSWLPPTLPTDIPT